MKKIGLFYGSDGGTTQEVAEKIAQQLNNVELHDVAKSNKETLKTYDYLILATPTYGSGDLQGDWEEFLGTLDSSDFAGKTVALVGLGDQESYEDTFCSGLYPIYDLAQKEGKIVGQTSFDGYTYADSKSVVNGAFVGLILDEANQEDLTQERIEKWCENLKAHFNT